MNDAHTEDKPGGLFDAALPDWANTLQNPEDAVPEARIVRLRQMIRTYYALAAQAGVHSMIEWAGVMTEYVYMLQNALQQGINPMDADQHKGTLVKVPEHMVNYFCEKLGCQLKPFVHANPQVWRKAIDKWFPPNV